MIFSLSTPWWGRVRDLWKLRDGRDWLRGKLGLVLLGRAMLSKSLIQFSLDWWGCVPSLVFTWGQTMVEVMKIMGTSFKRPYACTVTHTASNPAVGHYWPMPPLETSGHSRANLGQSLYGVTAPFSWVLVHTRFCLCLLRVYFPVLCKFWQFYGRVNGNLLQEGLCQTQLCCT